ncbi:MAG: CBS domain-containing protein [Hyphomicrobiales bacterium]
MQVKDIMHKGAYSAAPETGIRHVAAMMAEQDIGCIPVVDGGKLAGVITDRDIACRVVAAGQDCSDVTAEKVMSKEVIFCREAEEIGDAVHIMENNQVRRLPVIDADDHLTGMLSLGDVSHGTSREMTGEMVKAVSAHHEDPQLLKSAG